MIRMGPAGLSVVTEESSRAYRVPLGRSRVVDALLSAAEATRVRRSAKRLVATVTSLEFGIKGAETVSRQVKLR